MGTSTTVYETFGWVPNKWFIGKTITFTYYNQVLTVPVYQKRLRGFEVGGYCSFRINGKTVSRCPLKLLSGLGLEGKERNYVVLYHPERNIYAFARDICLVTGNIVENKNFSLGRGGNSVSYFYDADAMYSYRKAGQLLYHHPDKENKSVSSSELAREIYNSKDEDGNYRCHVSGVVMSLGNLNADHCHRTGKYMGLVTPEVNSIEGQLKKLLACKGLEFTHEERLDLIRGMLQGAEKMHNKRLMEIWESTVTSKEQKKTSIQQSTPMQLCLDL